jgi:prolipoprotein diacylglyceryltransferase
VMLYLWRHFTARGRLLIAGDVGLIYFAWYGMERSILETFRFGYNWTFFGIPTAQVVGVGAGVAAFITIFIRHWWVRNHPDKDEPETMPAPEASAEAA